MKNNNNNNIFTKAWPQNGNVKFVTPCSRGQSSTALIYQKGDQLSVQLNVNFPLIDGFTVSFYSTAYPYQSTPYDGCSVAKVTVKEKFDESCTGNKRWLKISWHESFI